MRGGSFVKQLFGGEEGERLDSSAIVGMSLCPPVALGPMDPLETDFLRLLIGAGGPLTAFWDCPRGLPRPARCHVGLHVPLVIWGPILVHLFVNDLRESILV